jgi:hypothetical protein
MRIAQAAINKVAIADAAWASNALVFDRDRRVVRKFLLFVDVAGAR